MPDNDVDKNELTDLQQLVASDGFKRFQAHIAAEWGPEAQMQKIDAVLSALEPGNVDGEYTTVSQVRAAATRIHELARWPDTRIAQLKGEKPKVERALDRFRRIAR